MFLDLYFRSPGHEAQHSVDVISVQLQMSHLLPYLTMTKSHFFKYSCEGCCSFYIKARGRKHFQTTLNLLSLSIQVLNVCVVADGYIF